VEEECELTELPKSMCAHCLKLKNPEKEIRHAECKNCGDERVTWMISEKGNWYLRNLNADGELSPTPHFKTCAGSLHPVITYDRWE
jgi:hypothetical protein